MYSSFNSSQIALTIFYYILYLYRVAYAIGFAYRTYIICVYILYLYKLSTYARVNLFVTFLVQSHSSFYSLLQKVSSTQNQSTMVFQLIIKTDKEVKHRIIQFVCLVQNNNRVFFVS